MYNVHPPFWAKLSGKKILFYFFNSIFIHLYLDSCFLYYKEILVFILNILWYKKLYVANNYKTQEQIKCVLGTTHV